MMTERLKRAVATVTSVAHQAERLTPEAQDTLAAHIEALASELRWDTLLDDPARSDAIDRLADEALADFHAGRTQS